MIKADGGGAGRGAAPVAACGGATGPESVAADGFLPGLWLDGVVVPH